MLSLLILLPASSGDSTTAFTVDFVRLKTRSVNGYEIQYFTTHIIHNTERVSYKRIDS